MAAHRTVTQVNAPTPWGPPRKNDVAPRPPPPPPPQLPLWFTPGF